LRAVCQLFELQDCVGDTIGIAALAIGDHDLRMPRGQVFLAVGVKFFVEFLAGAKSGEFDFDVFAHTEAGESDHVGSQIDDADGFSHIEEEDLTVIPNGAGLNDELCCFGDGHEESLHAWIGNGYRTTGCNLLTEDGYDAASRVKNVAEAYGDESAGRLAGAGLDVHFGGAFAGPHDAGRVDGFVGRDHDEGFDVVFLGKVGQASCGADDVLDGLAGMGFHEGNVLVGGGVEDDFGLILLEQRRHSFAVEDIGEADFYLTIRKFCQEFAFQEELAGFASIDEDDSSWREAQELAADFRADAAGTSGDHERTSFEPIAKAGRFQFDLFPAEQVIDGHRPRLNVDFVADQVLIAG